MSYTKKLFTDNQTVIGAEFLNEIQDEILTAESNIIDDVKAVYSTLTFECAAGNSTTFTCRPTIPAGYKFIGFLNYISPYNTSLLITYRSISNGTITMAARNLGTTNFNNSVTCNFLVGRSAIS